MSAYISLTPTGGDEFVLITPPHRPWVLVEQDWGNPLWQHEFAAPRGTQGARPSQGKLPNRTVTLAVKLYGVSADDVAARLSELETVMGQLRRHGGIITRKVHGQTHRQYLRVLTTPGEALPAWDKRSDLHHTVSPLLEFTCAPYAEGEPMAWVQDYLTDADAATLEVGIGAADDIVLEDYGALRYDAATGGAAALLVDTFRGYAYGDVRMDERSLHPGTALNARRGVVLRYLDASNYLMAVAQYETSGSAGFLRIIAVVGGVETVVAQATGLGTTVYGIGWVSAWIEGRSVYAQFRQSSSPSPYSEHSAVTASTSGIITPAQEAAIGRTGRVGVVLPPTAAASGRGLFQLRCQPFYYQGRPVPQLGTMPLLGGIPGDATALGEVSITTPAANTVPARWAMIGWGQRRTGRNLCWNGNHGLGTTGWSGAAVSGITSGTTSIAQGSTAPDHEGQHYLSVNTPTTDTSGATFRMVDSFRAGRTYRASMRVRLLPNVNGPMELVLGVSGDLAVRTAATPASSTAFEEWTVDWSPAADQTIAYVGIRADGATGPDALIAAVAVWDVTEDLATHQLLGKGGHSPLSVIPAISSEQNPNSTETTVTSRVGAVERATASGAGSLPLSVILDPTVIESDDYSDDETELEVWAMVNMDNDLTGVRGAVWVNPLEAAYNGDTLGARRAAHLWGTGGRPITKPITGDAWRLVRMGIVPVSIHRTNPSPIRLTVEFTWTGGSNNLDVDYLVVCPVRSRCLSPTNVSYADGGYPEFISTHADEVTKTVRSDLSAVVSAPPNLTRHPDHGLGGSLLELPPGEVDLLVVLSDLVPDDPDDSASSAANSISAAIAVSPVPRWSHLRDA